MRLKRPCNPTMHNENRTSWNVRTLRTPIRFALGTVALFLSLASASAGQSSEIQNLVTSGNLEGMRWPNFSDYRSWLQKFYGPAGYAPAWIQGTQPVPQAVALIDRFRDAGKKGLDPED